MNPQLLSTTDAVDPVFFYILGISVFFLLAITVVMIVFVVKYHRRRHPHPTSQVRQNVLLEIVWTVIPTLIALSMFYYGWAGYMTLQRVPEGAMEVTVTGRMWSWQFEYANGRLSDKLYVPAGQPVKVNIRSADVLHSFYVPAFRVKKDAVPGMDTYVWFTAGDTGSYDIFCTEYCGVGHSSMITTVEAMTPEEFSAWYEEKEETAGGREELAELLGRYGCLGCHSLDGAPGVGPTLQGVFGRSVTVEADGEQRTVTADRAYLQRAILEPQAEIVVGFPPVMPSFAGQIAEEDLVKMLDAFAGSGEKVSGEKLAQEQGCLGCHSTDGTPRVGPTLQGVFGRQVTIERDGQVLTVTADEEYLREAIRQPEKAITQGFPPVMPPFPELTEEEMTALIDYLKGLH